MKSAIAKLENQLEQLQSAMNDIKFEKGKKRCPNVEANTTSRLVPEQDSNDDEVPVEELMIIDGNLEGKNVKVLKDDGCNTNVVSKAFFNKNRKLFKWRRDDIEVWHSKSKSLENSTEVIQGATLRIGKHSYKSNWVVASCRYDVLLGMPWHVANNPSIDYKKRTVKVASNELLSRKKGHKPKCQVLNLDVKKFRRYLKKNPRNSTVQIYQVMQVDGTAKNKKNSKEMLLKCDNVYLRRLLNKYEEVFQEELPAGLPPERPVDHEIETKENEKPPHRSLYQLSPMELKATKEYVEGLLRKGKIRPSKSPYGAPLFFVKNKDEPLRGVVDYRALNRITKRNNAPLPRSDEMFDLIGEAKVFSRMDLKTGFHQIRVREKDIEKTAFNTKYGQFEYLVMPMGLCNSPATFQSLMNRIFYDCVDVFMVVYMDDLLIFSKDEESHIRHLETVLSRLKENKLYVSPKKCEFMKNELDFLGLVVGKEGIRVNPKKVEVLKTWPKPKTLTEVRSFMGLLQFFRRFIKDFSKISAPLTNLTKKGVGIQKWDESCDEAFDTLKEAITSAPVLVPPDWKKPFRGHIDASESAVGGTLTQLDDDGNERAIAFFSKKLSQAEQNYTANDRELLGLIYFLQRFRCYLEGSEFEIFTDNQVLRHLFTKPNISRREARWLETLGNFGIFPINLKPGKIHVLGDVLSRAPHIAVNDLEAVSINEDDIFSCLEEDDFYGPLLKVLRGEKLKDSVKDRKFRILSKYFHEDERGLFYEGKRCVPKKSVPKLLQLAHDSKIAGHFGFYKTMSRLKRFYWKNKAQDVKRYVQGCMTCQQKKDHHGKRFGDPNALEIPTRRWGSLATDFIVSLPKTKNGYNCITTWVDRLSRRVHFIPSKEEDTAVDVANSFYKNIFKYHGMPDSIVSDRDPKFTSKFWKKLMELLGVQLKMSTSRHPQTDGLSEVMNRMVENYLRCYCNYHQNDWDELLPAAEFAYNSAVSEDLGMSPFEVDLGYCPKSPLELISDAKHENESVQEFKTRLKESLNDAIYAHKIAKASQSARSSLKYKPHAYEVGDKLWINKSLFKDAYSKSQESDKLSAKRFGPFKVTKLIGKNAVELDLPDNVKIHKVVNIMHTRPFFEQPEGIASIVPERPDPVPTSEGEEYVVEAILKHRKKRKGFQFLTLMKGSPTHEAEWQPTKDFVDKDGTMNDKFYEYIKKNGILKNLWNTEPNNVVEDDNERRR